jgi:hypothetical protein
MVNAAAISINFHRHDIIRLEAEGTAIKMQ